MRLYRKILVLYAPQGQNQKNRRGFFLYSTKDLWWDCGGTPYQGKKKKAARIAASR
jgi:hypothetical protein